MGSFDWQFVVVTVAAIAAAVVLVRTLAGCAKDGSCADCSCPHEPQTAAPGAGVVQIGAHRPRSDR